MRSRNHPFPIFSAFGVNPRKLSNEEALAAGADERIASVWQYMTKKAIRFAETLSHRERANFDVEDVLAEIFVELKEKDSLWNPERGTYITFASRIASRLMSDLRDRSRTVESPANCSHRIALYVAAEERGELTDKQARTFADVVRSSKTCSAIARRNENGTEWAEPSRSDEAVEDREHSMIVDDAITWGLCALTPFEALVISRWSGLRGQEPQTLAQIADGTGRSIYFVKQAKEAALCKIRERLLSMGHPAIASDN